MSQLWTEKEFNEYMAGQKVETNISSDAETTGDGSLKCDARIALESGFHIFALNPRRKDPDPQESPNGFKSSTNVRSRVEDIWNRKPTANIGIDCGASNLAVLDFDDHEKIPGWVANLKTFKVETSRGLHVYFRGARSSVDMTNDAGEHIGEIKSAGGYVLAAGSLHPDGPTYRVVDDSPVANAPEEIATLTNRPAKPSASVNGDPIPYGTHDKELTRIGGKLRHDGLEEDALTAALIEICEKRCENYGDDYRLMCEKIAKSVCRYEVGKDMRPLVGGKRAGEVNEPEPSGSRLKTTRADGIKTKKIKWLWDYRIPFGKLSVFAGNPDQGKSLVTMYMVSQLTTGRPLYGSTNILPACEVLILAGEDEADDTIIPRLEAGGANLKRIHIVESVSVTDGKGQTVAERETQLDTDLQAIDEMLQRNPNIRLVIVDPLSNYLGDTNMNREQEVRRRVLIPLKNLAAKRSVAVLAVMHLNKSSDASAIHRIGGAVAFAGVARAVWLFLEDPTDKDKHLMLRVKGNIAKRIGGLSYSIKAKTVPVEGSPEYQPYVDWDGETDQAASDVLIGGAPAGRPAQKVKSAEEWLSSFLEKGGETAADVKKHGAKQGHTWRTIERAKTSLGIMVEKSGNVWEWSLPNQDRHNSTIVDLEASEAK